MSWHIVHLTERPATQWLNGGGLTRELAVWPAPGEWLWRMSVAEVEQSGPFSRFDGIQRWFAVLQGAGVRLSVAGSIHLLSTAEAPLLFDGDVPTDCQLLEGPTQDFNLMVRKSATPSKMVRVKEHLCMPVTGFKTIAVYAIDSNVNVLFNDENFCVPPATLIWRTVTKNATVQIAAEQALWMEIAQ